MAHLQRHGGETVVDVQAGADDYAALRDQWNGVVVAFAPYMDYHWSDIIAAG
ncbi:MAG: hypothetical protein AAFX01_01125 [Cyanobacteria bacterium J06638_28]